MSSEGDGYSDEPVQGFPNDTGNVNFFMIHTQNAFVSVLTKSIVKTRI